MKYPRYPAYKPSGLEWLGEIPAHWGVKKIKHVTSKIGSGKTPSGGSEVYVDDGILFIRSQNVYDEGMRLNEPVYITEAVDASMSGSRVEYNDVLLNITGASIGRCCLFDLGATRANVNQHVCIVRPAECIEPSFLAYALKSQNTKDQIFSGENGTSREGLNYQQVGNLYFAYPPAISEQIAIAAFLDRETAQIDTLIAKQERLIALLQEKRQALISHAVTRGLDPAAPMQESGVAWLGQVPAHWACSTLSRFTVSRCDGPFGSGLKTEHYVESGVRVIRLQNIGSATFIDSDRAYIDSEYYAGQLGDHDVLPGDLLIAGLGDSAHPTGRACVAPDSIQPAMVKADCFRFRMNEEVANSHFLAYQLSVTASACAGAMSTGATRSRMNLSTTASRLVALPPIDEQHDIVRHLVREVEKYQAVEYKVNKIIQLLQERRVALISAAVTGKIDVRNHL